MRPGGVEAPHRDSARTHRWPSNDTVDIAGLPPGKHKVKIELVDANHSVFPGQVVTLAFTVPSRWGMSHGGQGH